MTYKENTMMETKRFLLPDMVSDEFSSEDFAEDFEGLQMTFPRVKIPGGGITQFEMPGEDPENPSYEKTIEGVILYTHAAGAYWPEGSEYDDNATPFCFSNDGKTGYGTPGGACELCELNKYGTDSRGKGKACKNMRNLYILQSGAAMPVLLSLPPTSLRPYTDFVCAAFATKRRPIWSAVVQITLRRVENGANTYGVAVFRKLHHFSGEELAAVKAYAANFREQVKAMLEQRTAIAENRMEEEQSLVASTAYTCTEDGEHFCITPTIDGDRDELPM